MNFIVKTLINGKETPIIYGAKIGDEFYSVKEILSQDYCDGIYLDSIEGFDYPVLVPEDLSDTDSNWDLTGVYKVLKAKNLDAPQDYLEKLEQKIQGLFKVDELVTLEKLFSVAEEYLSGNVCKIKVSRTQYVFEHKDLTLQLVNKINSSGSTETLMIKGENKTVVMEKDDDEFFITVPSYYELMADDCSLPPVYTVYRPYKNLKLATPSYKEVATPDELPLVEGNPENNDLPIQENEMRYKEALMSLMKQGISKEFPDKDPDKCIKMGIGSVVVRDYIVNIALLGLYENWSHTGGVAKNLYTEFCEFTDTNSVGLQEDELSDEDLNNEAKLVENVEGNRVYYSTTTLRDYSDDLSAILKDKVFKRSPEDLIDFAIKLNRFGKRKPTRIQICEGEYLDLNSFRVVKGSGNYSQAEEVVDEEGNNLEVAYVINMSDFINDRKYIAKNKIPENSCSIDLPVGFYCAKKFKSGESLGVFMSFIDVIQAYKDGMDGKDKHNRCKIKGVTYDRASNKIILSDEVKEKINFKIGLRESIDLVLVRNNQCFYNYPGFIEAFFAKDCYDKKLSILTIMKDFYGSDDLSVLDMYSYDSIEELDEIIKSYRGLAPRVVIESNIARFVLQILNDTNKKFVNGFLDNINYDLEGIINLFNSSMEEIGFTGKFGDSGFSKEDVANKSSAFSRQSNNEEKEDEDMSKKLLDTNVEGKLIAAVFMSDEDYAAVSQKTNLVLKEKRNVKIRGVETSINVIGYIALTLDDNNRPTGEKIFMSPNGDKRPFKATLNVRKLSPALCSNVKAVVNNSDTSFKYDSPETCTYYCDVVNALIQHVMGA